MNSLFSTFLLVEQPKSLQTKFLLSLEFGRSNNPTEVDILDHIS